MSALELIKQGIAEGDMQKISKGYQMMTGEKVETAQISDKHLQQLKAVFSDLQGKHTPSPTIEPPAEPLPLPSDSVEEIYIPEPDVEESPEELEKLFLDVQQPASDEGFSPANPALQALDTPQLILPAQPMTNKTSLLVPEVLDNNEASNVGSRKCTAVAFQIKKRVNKFRDNLAIASKDRIFDQKVRSADSQEAHKYIEKRPPDTGVVVQCRDCNRRFRISSKSAPIRFDSSDSMNYQCDNCILRNKARG